MANSGLLGISARVCQHIIALIRVCVFVLPSYMCISIDWISIRYL